MSAGQFGYSHEVGVVGPAGQLLHVRRASPIGHARALCGVACGPMVPGLELSRAYLHVTCQGCALAYSRQVSKAPKRKREPSELEEILAGQIRALGLPQPDREAEFAREVLGRGWRLDFFWRPQSLAVEVDGGIWLPPTVAGAHRGGKEIEQDMIRNAAVVLLGIRLLRLSPDLVQSGIGVQWIALALERKSPGTQPALFPGDDAMAEVRKLNRKKFRKAGRPQPRRH